MTGVVPTLRFKQDDGSNFPTWKKCKFGIFVEEFKQNSTKQDEYEVLTSARSGLIRQKDYYDNDRITERLNAGFNIIPCNYMTYRSRSDNRRFYFNENNLGITGIISTYYPVFKIKNGINKFFIELLFYHQHKIGQYSVGTSQTVLSINELKKIYFSVPSLPEQQKIADFLSSVDAKIDAVKRKLSAFERYKKSLMQQIFSQKIRFKQDDGSDFPEWKEKRLGLLGKFTGGGTPDTNNTFYWNGHIPWISSSDILEGNINEPRITRFINEEALRDSATKIVPARSILIVTRVGVGKLAVSTHDICTSQDFTSFTPSRDNVFFLGFWMLSNKNALLKLCQGTSIKGLTSDDLKSLIVPIPSLPEQQRIADFLSAIDAKIDAIKAQIEKLEAFKKGLLQQMFV